MTIYNSALKVHQRAPGVELQSLANTSSLPVDDEIQEAMKSRSIFQNIAGVAEGLAASKVFKSVGLGASVTVVAFCTLFMISNPVGWIVAATGVSLLAAKWILASAIVITFALFTLLSGVGQTPIEGTMEFEMSAIPRFFSSLFGSKNYNEIPVNQANSLFLGALPNALTDYKMMQKEKIKTAIAINENWELDPRGMSVPMGKQDYDNLDITWQQLEAVDHEMLSPEDLDRLADAIHEGLKRGNVYIHCRAGVGRSASGVAAYLMKYEGMSIEEACRLIKAHRPAASIWNKLHGLRDYQTHLYDRHEIVLEEPPGHIENAANELAYMQMKGKKPKLKKDRIATLQSAVY